MQFDWREGNNAQLLQSKEEFFARVLQSLEQAKQQVLIETCLLADDLLGQRFCQVLSALAQRGVKVKLRLDVRRLRHFSEPSSEQLSSAGVSISCYRGQLGKPMTRLHRRLVVIDQQRAFIGGCDFGQTLQPCSFELALEISGPIVADVQRLLLAPTQRKPGSLISWLNRYPEARLPAQGCHTGSAHMHLLTGAKHNLETALIEAIESAQNRISILTTHFCPPPALLSALLAAAERGVVVKLFIPKAATKGFNRLQQSLLKHAFSNAGGQLYSYCAPEISGKVILIDQAWVCLGSSNLDPQSLVRNIEADIIIRDYTLNQQLHQLIEQLPNHQRLNQPMAQEQQGLGLSQFALDGLYYLRRHFAGLDRRLAIASLSHHPLPTGTAKQA